MDSVSKASLVKRQFFNSHQLPLVILPSMPEVSLKAWIRSHRREVEKDLLRYGAVLFREPSWCSSDDFEEVVDALTDEVLNYRGGTSVRSRIKGSLYTSTEYPRELEIRLHNEMSYSGSWALKIFFYCLVPPADRGQTPIIDSRRLLNSLDEDIRRRFQEKGVLYVRSYKRSRIWQSFYETEDRSQVEEICRQAGREFEWLEGGGLRTRERRPATRIHPQTGEEVWFNYAHGFHISLMEEMVRLCSASDQGEVQEEMWPNTVFFGDGSEIPAADIARINHVIEQNLVQFDWRQGDVLVCDNMLVAHGRRPFSGPRKILVKLAEKHQP
jgi:alpha-ketoglutarate-dependent taurine dioxygenase